MTYEEFEWNILKLAYEDGLECFKPSFVAYALGLPHETVSEYLEQATHTGLLEMEVTDDGRLEYFIPGVDPDAQLPRPVWKGEAPASSTPGSTPARADQPGADQPGTDQPGAELTDEPPTPPHEGLGDAAQAPAAADPADPADPADGSVDRPGPPARRAPDAPETSRPLVARPSPPAGDGQMTVRAPHRSQLPAALRAHIEQRYGSEDGSVTTLSRNGAVAVLDRQATVHDADEVAFEGELVQSETQTLPLRIEPGDDTLTDPSQTIFMRQLKVYGVDSEEALREHVKRLFSSLGYEAAHIGADRMRFERGSVTFILALVPLFVLVVPLFVYLFLYCMGRSTIEQEPIELDVQFRKIAGQPGTYEIDLTFIGMHGVVLGAADQRVLNQEVDNLQDELQWALSSG